MNPAAVAPGAAAMIDGVGSAWHPTVLGGPNGEHRVVEYRDESHARRVVAKYYDDDSGAHSFAAMRAIRAALARRRGTRHFATPAALGYDAARRCLVQERVDGRAYDALADGAQAEHYLRLAGRALAEFHGLDLSLGDAKPLSAHVRELMRPHPELLAAAMPAHPARIAALLRALAEEEARLAASAERCPIHRDFHLRQLFFGGERVWLIDWDLGADGDPALDVGNFLMCLETRFPAPRAASLQDAFRRGYSDIRPAAMTHRLPLYKALNYLRRACKHFRLRRAGWEDRVESMLRAAETAIAADGEGRR